LLALLAFAAASLVLAGVHYCCSHVLAHTIFLGDHIKGIFAAASLVLAGTIELSNLEFTIIECTTFLGSNCYCGMEAIKSHDTSEIQEQKEDFTPSSRIIVLFIRS
jgi:hypothetical protein